MTKPLYSRINRTVLRWVQSRVWNQATETLRWRIEADVWDRAQQGEIEPRTALLRRGPA